LSDSGVPKSNNYPSLARQRARLRHAASSSTPRTQPGLPYQRSGVNRYTHVAQPTLVPTSGPGSIPAAAAISTEQIEQSTVNARSPKRTPRRPRDEHAHPIASTVSLKDEFARVKQGQEEVEKESRLPFGRPQRPVRAAIFSIALVIMIVGGALLGPVAYRAATAYREVFEEPVPREDAPFIAAAQPDGTKVIVQATGTTEAEAPKAEEWDGKERLTILLLGVDTREDDYSRSDTMILVNFDPVTKTASMLSIPRDLKVIIPGYGVHKINSAYSYGDADKVPGGGAGLTMRTIEANFGIRINYYAQVDFDGFVKVMDTVGGLTLDVPYPIKDDEYPGPGTQYMRIYFEPGWQHMDGTRVLQYARTRHDDGDGRRSARQQQVLIALQEQAISRDLISKAPELISELGDTVRTNLSPSQALQLARLASDIDPAKVVQFSLNDALYEDQQPDQPYYLIADWDAVGEILSEFTAETILPPMSALANPNYTIAIYIEDGTFNPGMGSRVSDVLTANGFTVQSIIDKLDLGNYPYSSIITDPENLTTAYLIASLLGIDLSAITVSDEILPTTTELATAEDANPTEASSVKPTVTGSPASSGAVALFPTPTGDASGSTVESESPATLVIVIGDDAPDPLYYTTDPYLDEPVEE